jgi:hypothetical protein
MGDRAVQLAATAISITVVLNVQRFKHSY